MSAPDPNPMMAPVSRSESDQRRASPAPSSSDAAASPPHIAAAYALIGCPQPASHRGPPCVRAAGGILPTLEAPRGRWVERLLHDHQISMRHLASSSNRRNCGGPNCEKVPSRSNGSSASGNRRCKVHNRIDPFSEDSSRGGSDARDGLQQHARRDPLRYRGVDELSRVLDATTAAGES